MKHAIRLFSSPLRALLFASAIFLFVPRVVPAQSDVLTWHNNDLRSGAVLNESILTPANVSSASFGLLATIRVDGKVDAQPLYVSALPIAGKGRHNVLFIATEHDSVYAVDADTGAALWKRSLLLSGETTSDERNCSQVTPEIGITATPVIDRKAGAHGTIYVVAMSKNGTGKYFHRIHALDLATGSEEANSPVIVTATYSGTGDGSLNGSVTFDPRQFKERPGLLLSNGILYTSWSSHCDSRPYGGWMMAYAQSSLAQTAVLDFVPNGSDAAPWNAGAGPAADAAGNIYISLGNGTFDTQLSMQGFPIRNDFGNSMLKLSLRSHALVPLDYWTMYNTVSESSSDIDLGSGGLMLVPNQTDAGGVVRQLVVAAGKDHNIYVADSSAMGHFNSSSNSGLYQELAGSLQGGEYSSPAYWNSHVYYGSVGQPLQSFSVQGAKLIHSAGQSTATSFSYPGTTPSVSSYGATNGIVWAPANGSSAVLHAYDANNLGKELYNSSQAANGRDQFGVGNKFITPTIANGKVYVGTENSVGLFGFRRLKPAPLADGVYTMTNQYSRLLMDDAGGTSAAGNQMSQSVATGGVSQAWFFSYNGNGFYTIQNLASSLFLADTNGSTGPGTPLRQQRPAYDQTELWSVTPAANGAFVIRNKATGLAFDDSAYNKYPAQNMILWTANSMVNQNWILQH